MCHWLHDITLSGNACHLEKTTLHIYIFSLSPIPGFSTVTAYHHRVNMILL